MLGQIGRTTKIDLDYSAAISRICQQEPSRNVRTGKWVKAVPGLYISCKPSQFPVLHLRDISPLWSCAEAVWFLSGARSTKLMAKYGFKTWDKFADGDGNVESATGFRWRSAHAVDQVQEVFKKLKADSTSRQAVIVSWVPAWDLIKPGPNAPCIVAWHFHVIDGELHMSALQRAADM